MRILRLILIFVAMSLVGFLPIAVLLTDENLVDYEVLVYAQPESARSLLVKLEKWHFLNGYKILPRHLD